MTTEATEPLSLMIDAPPQPRPSPVPPPGTELAAQPGLEEALTELDRALAMTARALAAVQKQLKRALGGAREGRLRDLPPALEALVEHSQALTQAAVNARSSWSFDGQAYLESRLLADVVTLAERSDLPGVKQIDGHLYSFPVVVKVKPRDLSLEVGRKVERGVRPSWVVQRLRKLRQSGSARDNVSSLLEAFEKAYLILTRGTDGEAVLLCDLYDLLVLRPGQGRDYTLTDFMLDVYRFDRAMSDGPLRTRRGRELSLPASTGARAGQGIRRAGHPVGYRDR